MARTALYAPAHRVLGRLPPGVASTALPYGAAPSLDFLAGGLQDHRLPWNTAKSSTGAEIAGWLGADPFMVIDAVPSQLQVNNIAVAANVVSGTAMTLVAASGAGITVLAAATLFLPSLLSISSGLVIDVVPAALKFGNAAFYDRSKMIGRALSITGAAGATGGDFLVRGYDVYGYAMSETITAGAGAVTTNGKKAFKVVTSVTPQFTDAHNYSVGTADIFGFGLRANHFSDVLIHWNDALITANTGFVAPDTTSPATSATGDVRGTYAVQSASDGTKRLVVRVSPSLASVQSNPTTGLFGIAQA